jgi:3-phosphoshikimate 1-carboxyvinyltransferase
VQLGATVDHHGEPGYPPLTITPPRSLPRCVKIDLPELESSQYLTALLLIAPLLPGGVTLTSHHPVTSASYVRLTLGLLDTLGASVRMSEDLGVIRVSPAADARTSPTMPAFELDIEPDASGATYFWGAGALGAHCAVSGIPRSSLQPDARLPDLLVRMGCRIERAGDTTTGVRPGPELLPIMADLSDMPDAAMTLAALAAFASGRSMLSGLETLRVKETDRIAAIGAELAKIGVKVETPVLGDKGAVAIEPPTGGIDCAKTASRVEFDTYNDHRMAMAMSLIGIRRPNTFIRNPACVAKTYPQYWRDLADTLD